MKVTLEHIERATLREKTYKDPNYEEAVIFKKIQTCSITDP